MDLQNWGVIKNPLLKSFFEGKFRHMSKTGYGTIRANRIVELDSSGRFTEASAESAGVVGVYKGKTVLTGKPVDLDFGRVQLVAACPIARPGLKLKAVTGGLVAPVIVTQATIKAATAGNFGNQPANDGVEVVSDSADDNGSVTIYGTTHGESAIVSEVVMLDGTTPVATVKTDWGVILAVVAAAHAGTITVREASADQAITTLASGTLSKGLDLVDAADQNAFGSIPVVAAGGASTKVVGIEYITVEGAVATEVKTLNGTNAVAFTNRAARVTKVFGGDVATATVATVKTAAAETTVAKVGVSLASAAAEGAEFEAYLLVSV